ncbi:MAG: phosphoribosylamine--glycine ligase [Planctomycetota bacterium]
MKALILGAGAREHTIAWKMAMSRRIAGLYIAPGNAGTAEAGENLPEVNPESTESVLKACVDNHINLVVVGPEGPLALGIVDEIKKKGISVIGPHKEAAQLESSKAFSKEFMTRHSIPTAAAIKFSIGESEIFRNHVDSASGKLVIKKSGLASGKGVLESDNKEEIIAFGEKILMSDALLVEEYLIGYEISLFAFTDGKSYTLLPPAADFKKAGENDSGLNTGGMGAICPVPIVGSKLLADVEHNIVAPTFKGLTLDGLSFIGVLYFGLMITKSGPKLLEYNVRWGDPETQVLVPLIKSDFVNLCEAILDGTLDKFPLQIATDSALGVVVASRGYPGEYAKGITVESLPKSKDMNQLVFHASTKRDTKGRVVTGGGRCFTVVGIGPDGLSANQRAYKAVSEVAFDGAWWREDIGKKFFVNEGPE